MNRLALRVLVVSVALSAGLGCYALLAGDWGDLQVKTLLSSLTISGASILAMACAPALEREGWRSVSRGGIGLALAAAALVLLGVWAEIGGETFWRSTGTAGLLAVAVAHACLLALPTLAVRHRWLRHATLGVNAGLTLLLLLVVWAVARGEDVWRLIGVLSILLCAGTILVPVLGRAARGETGGISRGARFCPACGACVDPPARSASCAACGARFDARWRQGVSTPGPRT